MSKGVESSGEEDSLSRTKWLSFICVLSGAALSVLDSTAISLASPSIAKSFNAPASNVVLMMSGFQISVLALLLPLAVLGQRLGYRLIYLVGLLFFTISSCFAFFAESLNALIIARIFQGMGAAGMMSVSTALVRLIFPESKLGRGLATNSMVVAIASVAGPLLTASILSLASWRWIFAVNALLGFLTIALALQSLPENQHYDKRPGSPLNFGAGLVLNAFSFSLIFIGANALALGKGLPGTSAVAWGTLVIGLIVACLYIWHQSRSAHPVLPLDVLKIEKFSRPLGASVCAYCALTLAHLALPFLLLETYKISTFETSFLLTGWPLAIVLVAPWAGRLVGRHSNRLLSSAGVLCFACGLFLLAFTPAEITKLDPSWRIIMCGAGFALFQTPNYHSIITSTPAERTGAGSAMISVARLIGQALGATILAAAFALSPVQSGFPEMIGLLVASGFALLALVLTSLAPGDRIQNP